METCPIGKSCYQTWRQADHRAKAMNRYRPQDGEYFMASKCHRCSHYHVGGRTKLSKGKEQLRREKIKEKEGKYVRKYGTIE